MSGKHGYISEDNLENICHHLFGCDLILRSPTLIEESGSKELTDILILIDDTAIIIQSKSLQMTLKNVTARQFYRIKKRQEIAKKQLNTTLNAHKRNALVEAETPLGIKFTINWEQINHKIGIVTINVPDEVYSNPELRFQYPEMVERHKGIDVHTFLVNDLAMMISELTTPADVLLYLDARKLCAEANKFIIKNELDFLVLYKTQYPKIEEALSNENFHVAVIPGSWEDYLKNRQNIIKGRTDRFQNSVLIDNIIRQLNTTVDYSVEKYAISKQKSAEQYLLLTGKLNKLTRMERAEIGNRLRAKYEKTRTEFQGYFLWFSENADTSYLFLVTNEKDREKRIMFLIHLCEQACHYVNSSIIVGLVMDGAQTEGSSIDSVGMDVAEVKAGTKPDNEFPIFEKSVFQELNEWE